MRRHAGCAWGGGGGLPDLLRDGPWAGCRCLAWPLGCSVWQTRPPAAWCMARGVQPWAAPSGVLRLGAHTCNCPMCPADAHVHRNTWQALACVCPAETNSLYWPWYCDQTSFGARLLKGLLQGECANADRSSVA